MFALKTKRLLVFLLSCLMVMAMLPMTVFGAGDAATPASGMTITKKTTQEQLDNWAGKGALTIRSEGESTIVTLQKDIKMGILGGNPSKATTPINFGTYPESVADAMVLDLNGHQIASDTMVIVSVCNLTITDSVGTGGVFMDTSDSSASAFEAVVNQVKLTIEGGTYEAKIHSSKSTVGVIGSAVAGVETTINGGTFISTGSAVQVSSGTTLINGGEFKGGNYGIVAKKTAQVIFPENSTATVTSPQFPLVIGKSGDTTGSITISGGSFNGTDTASLVGGIGTPDTVTAVQIDGGTFTQDPGRYTGTEAVALIDGVFIIGQDTIAAASKNAPEGTVIKITKGDVTLTDLAEGITVENAGTGSVSVNDKVLNPSESITVHTHVWGEPIFTWSEDGKSATAKRICTKDPNHIEQLDALVTSVIKTPATCTQKGITLYTAKVTFDGIEYTATKEVSDIAMSAHIYKDGKCTVCDATDPNLKPATPKTGIERENLPSFVLPILFALTVMVLFALRKQKS